MISIVVLLVVLVLIFSSLSGGEIFGFLSQDMNTPHRTDTRVSQDTSQTSQMTTSQENIIEEIAKTQTDPPPSPTKQLTSTPTDVKPVLTLDIPIGSEYQFIIHRVKEGESLQIFADLYNTSVEAIRAVNYDLIAPLWIDWLVIIPVNTTDVEDIPTFEPYQVESDQITISELSKQLSTQLEDLLLYNNLDSEHVLYQGEWLLIPRERSEP
ncbi:MAG: LysM domain-containing protein [Chloroflexota bacterium]|nr:LysM domain-containing protein [Chloroflexota bacterium]